MLAPAVKAGTYGRCHIPCICTTNSAVRIAQSRTKARTSESRRRSCGMKSRRFPPASCCDRFAEQGLVAWGVQRRFCLKGTSSSPSHLIYLFIYCYRYGQRAFFFAFGEGVATARNPSSAITYSSIELLRYTRLRCTLRALPCQQVAKPTSSMPCTQCSRDR